MFRKVFIFNILIFFLLFFLLEIIARTFHMADLTGVSKNMLIFDKSIHRNATNVEAIVFSKKAFTDEFGFRVPN